MSDSKKKAFPLNITPSEENEWVNFSVMDGNNTFLSKQTGSFSMDLPAGLYTVQSELSGATASQIIRHTGEKTYRVDLPEDKERYEVNEEMERLAARESQELTTKRFTGNAQLFIFIECKNVKKKDYEAIRDTVRLFDIFNNQIQLTHKDWRMDQASEVLILNISIAKTVHFLNFKTKDKNRSFLVETFEEKQTQVFVTFKKTFQFDELVILIGRGMEYNPDFKTKSSYLTALEKMSFGDFSLSPHLIRDLVNQKWVQPMYGLVVSYVYLLGDHDTHDDLIGEVVRNLKNRILNTDHSSDVRLLKMLLEQRENPKVDFSKEEPFMYPPVFKVGLQRLYQLSNHFPNLVKQHSLTDLVSDRINNDTVWTSFTPYKNVYRIEKGQRPKRSNARRALNSAFKKRSFARFEPNLKEETNSADWVSSLLSKLIEYEEYRDIFVNNEMVGSLSRFLGLPKISIQRKIDDLEALMKKDEVTIRKALYALRSKHKEGMDFETFRKKLKEWKSALD